jgi:hypothetical protein
VRKSIVLVRTASGSLASEPDTSRLEPGAGPRRRSNRGRVARDVDGLSPIVAGHAGDGYGSQGSGVLATRAADARVGRKRTLRIDVAELPLWCHAPLSEGRVAESADLCSFGSRALGLHFARCSSDTPEARSRKTRCRTSRCGNQVVFGIENARKRVCPRRAQRTNEQYRGESKRNDFRSHHTVRQTEICPQYNGVALYSWSDVVGRSRSRRWVN